MKDFEIGLKKFKEVPHDKIGDYVIIWNEPINGQISGPHIGWFGLGSREDHIEDQLDSFMNLLEVGLARLLTIADLDTQHRDYILETFMERTKKTINDFISEERKPH